MSVTSEFDEDEGVECGDEDCGEAETDGEYVGVKYQQQIRFQIRRRAKSGRQSVGLV